MPDFDLSAIHCAGSSFGTDELEMVRRPGGGVERHANVLQNAWVVSGTRIPTSAVRNFWVAGYTVSQIQKEYPSLTSQDIVAALTHRGAPIVPMVITPEMIEAGASVLWGFETETAGEEYWAEEVYRAMEEARRKLK